MSQSASVYFVVGDADGLYAWHRANGVEIVEPPRDQPYRLREFTVRDLDGYYLNFGHRLTGGASQLRQVSVEWRSRTRRCSRQAAGRQV